MGLSTPRCPTAAYSHVKVPSQAAHQCVVHALGGAGSAWQAVPRPDTCAKVRHISLQRQRSKCFRNATPVDARR